MTNEQASIRIANGADTSPTRNPAKPGPATWAMAADDSSLLFASINRSSSTK